MADLLTTRLGWQEVNYDLADIIIFNGGADIGTAIYGEKPIGRGIPEKPSRRDQMEMDIFQKHKGKDKLLVGICRGSQLLNCLNDGTLWQDVDNHGRTHDIRILATGQTIRATSTHHQMMRPSSAGKVLATADCSHHKHSDHDSWNMNGGTFFADDHKDTEIVWYPDTNSLCIQGHPEYFPDSEFATFCLDMFNHYLEEIKSHAKA